MPSKFLSFSILYFFKCRLFIYAIYFLNFMLKFKMITINTPTFLGKPTKAQIFSFVQKFDRRTAVEFSTEPAILPNYCYLQFYSLVFVRVTISAPIDKALRIASIATTNFVKPFRGYISLKPRVTNVDILQYIL